MAYFVVSLRRHPGREESVLLEPEPAVVGADSTQAGSDGDADSDEVPVALEPPDPDPDSADGGGGNPPSGR
jgi:hypothetical protein